MALTETFRAASLRYNLTNQVNFGNPTGARNATQFLVRTVANDPRTAQLGLRVIF